METILGLIGACVGLTGFAVATLPKLYQFRRDFSDADPQKDEYQTQLDSVPTKLDNWRDLWCGQSAFSRQDYEHFWGLRGYESVRTKLRLTQTELLAIGRLLERKVHWALETEMSIKWGQTRDLLRGDEASRVVKTHANIK